MGIPQSHFESLHKIEEDYWWFSGRVQWAEGVLQDVVANIPKLEYIDIGCGTAGFSQSLIETFSPKRVLLVDGEQSVLSEVSRRLGVQTLATDLTKEFKLPFAPTLVTCMDVMEHLENDSSFLRRLSTQMASDGWLLLSVPALPLLFSEWDRSLGHFRRYSRGTLKKAFRDGGFEIVEFRPMWSFLVPAVYFTRKVLRRPNDQVEFPPVSSWVNKLLTIASRVEFAVGKYLPLPFGTSYFVLARPLPKR